MSWERRWRELVLAGGAIVAAACSSSHGDSSGADASGSSSGSAPNFCCNANPDPCCGYLSCGAPLDDNCSAKMACQADGGTWTFPTTAMEPDGEFFIPGCSLDPQAPIYVDAGVRDLLCCASDPGSCCPYVPCGGDASNGNEVAMTCQCLNEAGASHCFYSDAGPAEAGSDTTPPDGEGG